MRSCHKLISGRRGCLNRHSLIQGPLLIVRWPRLATLLALIGLHLSDRDVLREIILRELELLEVALGQLHRRAEKVEPAHVARALDLDALLAALLDDLRLALLCLLGRLLGRLLLGRLLRLLRIDQLLLSAAVQLEDGSLALSIGRHWVRTLIKTDKQGRGYYSVSPMMTRIGALAVAAAMVLQALGLLWMWRLAKVRV